MDNIIFIEMLLNNIISDTHNLSINVIPRLKLPNFIEDFDLLLNQKDVLTANKQNFYNLASKRITQTEEKVKHYSLFLVICYILSPIIAIIVFHIICMY